MSYCHGIDIILLFIAIVIVIACLVIYISLQCIAEGNAENIEEVPESTPPGDGE